MELISVASSLALMAKTVSCMVLENLFVVSVKSQTYEDKRVNNKTMHRDTRNSGAAGYQGPVKIELRKGAGLVTLASYHS